MRKYLSCAAAVAASAMFSAGLLSTPASAAVTPNAVGDQQMIVLENPLNGKNSGFASLTTDSAGTGRILEICVTDTSGATNLIQAQINPANASGGATSTLINYEDDAGGGCYVRTINYPIRKFRAFWFGDGDLENDSPWELPPAL